ncbi:malate synthase G [Microvirga sp. W0021]|uniref:Malate synthase G n=1 Tax=Hohaiivirga grylli TaxID=3133970 RepID=A0ABV0BPF8_9HYPH
MSTYVNRAGLKVAAELADFIEHKALSGLDVTAESFWQGLTSLVETHMPENRALLNIRAELQKQIDDWHPKHGPATSQMENYISFLKEIGYLEDEPASFQISTENLDPEITHLCGPQLVVPVSNARYALNAANARWGSLYDALYGTDAISRQGELAPGKTYNAIRGKAVFERAAAFLDQAFPINGASHNDVIGYSISQNGDGAQLILQTASGEVQLNNPDAFHGFSESNKGLHILLRHHGLFAELLINSADMIGKLHPAHVADVTIESALSAIQDCEDSVAAVNAADKVHIYSNWLGLMRGDLEDTFEKNGKQTTRRLNPERSYTGRDGQPLKIRSRSLQLVRNVGHLMMSDAILDKNNDPIGEGIMDAAVTTLCAMHDLKLKTNSQTGAIYIVKPKMHGSREVAFACQVFTDVENFLGLPKNTIKIGVMDEERRTSANLKACIFAARERIFFINTGFLDRTGDEIHTSMEAGPVLPKDQIKSERWLLAYENRNVTIGLSCGLSGKAQIGKGMWAKPDDMADMLTQKIGHPKAGANCAWVPSPTAATLHALHYHEVDVHAVQRARLSEPTASLEYLFSMPVLDPQSLSAEQIQRELDNNAQGILGYVVRWVDQGIGCSKVLDINNVALMEDRATCRISSQAIANWLRHGLVSQEQVLASFTHMARTVDEQNAGDPLYIRMSDNPDRSVAFKAALDLAIEGTVQSSGYTEPILHASRLRFLEK